MSQNISFNGSNYTIPDVGDLDWGQNVTDYLVAIPNGALQPIGGLFSLSADVDFGANFGLESIYFKSRTANEAGAGILRLARVDSVGWRNNANTADLLLSVTAANQLTFDGVPVAMSGGGTVNLGTQFQLAYYAANGTAVSGLTLITASRALASDANGLPVASAVTATEQGYVSGVTSSIQSQINAKATGVISSGSVGFFTYYSAATTLSDQALISTDLTNITLASGQFINPAGTVGLPTITFAGSLTSGIYLPSADVVGFATSGVQRMFLDSAGVNITGGQSLLMSGSAQFIAPVGTVSLPGMTFNGDPDTGLYWRLADSPAVSAGGAIVWDWNPTVNRSHVAFEVLATGIRNVDGSAAAPSYSFASDPDTGWYRTSADSMGWTTGGVLKWDFNSAGTMRAQSSSYGINAGLGSVSAPSYSFTGDEDTGMYRATGNNIGFAANGVNSLTISDSSMISAVRIYAPDGTQGSPAVAFNNDVDTGFYRISSDQWALVTGGNLAIRTTTSNIAFYTQNVERWNVISSGNLIPVTDNTYSLGQSGSRTSSVWSANGTIQTSHSSTKSEIVDVNPSLVELPRGVFYNRDGRRWLGYLNDSLPNEGRPFDEDGNICAKDNYEQAMVGILCAHVRKLEVELAELKATAKYN